MKVSGHVFMCFSFYYHENDADVYGPIFYTFKIW